MLVEPVAVAVDAEVEVEVELTAPPQPGEPAAPARCVHQLILVPSNFVSNSLWTLPDQIAKMSTTPATSETTSPDRRPFLSKGAGAAAGGPWACAGFAPALCPCTC